MKNIFSCATIIASKGTPLQPEAEIIFREFYSDRRLTDCLEVLEEQGFHKDTAIFLLGFLGGLG